MKLLFILLSLSFSVAVKAEFIAKVDFVRGNITVNGVNPAFPINLREGDKIRAFPKTKPKKTGSFVRIIFANGDKVGLSNGEIVLEKFNKKESIFGLIKGQFFNYAKPGLDRKLKVNSRNVSLGVRGTKYMIEEKPKYSYICVCEGEVIATKGGRNSSVKAGFDLKVLPGKPINQSIEANAAMLKMVTDNFALLGEPVQKTDINK